MIYRTGDRNLIDGIHIGGKKEGQFILFYRHAVFWLVKMGEKHVVHFLFRVKVIFQSVIIDEDLNSFCVLKEVIKISVF